MSPGCLPPSLSLDSSAVSLWLGPKLLWQWAPEGVSPERVLCSDLSCDPPSKSIQYISPTQFTQRFGCILNVCLVMLPIVLFRKVQLVDLSLHSRSVLMTEPGRIWIAVVLVDRRLQKWEASYKIYVTKVFCCCTNCEITYNLAIRLANIVCRCVFEFTLLVCVLMRGCCSCLSTPSQSCPYWGNFKGRDTFAKPWG